MSLASYRGQQRMSLTSYPGQVRVGIDVLSTAYHAPMTDYVKYYLESVSKPLGHSDH